MVREHNVFSRRLKTRLPKVIWEQAASSPMVADPLSLKATMQKSSTVFAKWRQYARPYTARFLAGPAPLTIINGSSNSSTVFVWPMMHSAHTLHCLPHSSPPPQKKCPLPSETERPSIVPWTHLTHNPKGQLDRVSRFFSRIHGRYQRTDRQTDGENGHGTRLVKTEAAYATLSLCDAA